MAVTLNLYLIFGSRKRTVCSQIVIKYPVFLSYFKQIWSFARDFNRRLEYKTLRKS